jgi:hypothetical protein
MQRNLNNAHQPRYTADMPVRSDRLLHGELGHDGVAVF